MGAVKGIVRGRAAVQGASSDSTVRGSLCKVGADTWAGRGGEGRGEPGQGWKEMGAGRGGDPHHPWSKNLRASRKCFQPKPGGRGSPDL